MPSLTKGLDCLSLIAGQLSKEMKEAIIPMVFAPLGAMLTGVKFKHPSNVWMEPCGLMTCLTGVSGIGKGELNQIIEAIMRKAREHDKAELMRFINWQKVTKTKGANSKKDECPEVHYLYPPADTTGPALTKNAMALENAGDKTQFFKIPEIEMANRLCGGHRQVSETLRNVFDVERVGALRATQDGVTGNPTLRVNICFSSTPVAAQRFFKSDLYTGTFGRIHFFYKAQEERSGIIPEQGEYDNVFLDKLDVYISRLESCKGEFIIPPLNKLIKKLALDMADLANFADDDTLHALSKRSLIYGFKAGGILWILNKQEWTPAMARLVEWLAYYDLWSKYQVFGSMLVKGDSSVTEAGKTGPKNMLEDLGISFNEQELEALREKLGKSKDAKGQIKVWMSRRYIEFCPQTGLYTKTKSYLNHRH